MKGLGKMASEALCRSGARGERETGDSGLRGPVPATGGEESGGEAGLGRRPEF